MIKKDKNSKIEPIIFIGLICYFFVVKKEIEKSKNNKREKGITLIALIITIIILLILAGITITALGSENGLIAKSKNINEKYKLSEYQEEINIIINEEMTERASKQKLEPIIESIENKINTKEWVKDIKKYNKDGNAENDAEKSIFLIIYSKEGFEFVVEVKNNEITEKATILEANTKPKNRFENNDKPNDGNTTEGETIKGNMIEGGSTEDIEMPTFEIEVSDISETRLETKYKSRIRRYE